METFLITYNPRKYDDERPGAIIAFPPALSFIETFDVFSKFLSSDAQVFTCFTDGVTDYDEGEDLGHPICNVPLRDVPRARLLAFHDSPHLFTKISSMNGDETARLTAFWYVHAEHEPWFNGHYAGIWLPSYDTELLALASSVAKAPFDNNELLDLERIICGKNNQ